MGKPLRIDLEQRFTCSQCGLCCYRWDVAVSNAEIEYYRRRNVAAWYRETRDGDEAADGDLSAEARRAKVDPFEPVPGWPGLQRIRKRADGGCGFLSPDNRCRIHEELGADRKPLTCRMYPYSLHAAPDAIVVSVSFGCPTIVANQGQPIGAGASRDGIESLRDEWFGSRSTVTAARELVAGRAIDARSARVLRDSLLAILKTETADIRSSVRRIAAALDDLTRHRVVSLSDDALTEYVALTLPYAASRSDAPSPREPSRVGRLLQYGFLYAVAATRLAMEHREYSRLQLRLARLRLLAHFHRLAPSFDRVNVGALKTTHVDINAPEIRPIVFHYLRSSLESLGGRERPIIDDLAMAVSFLNSACALAVMNAAAAGRAVDREIFSDALMDAVQLWHTDDHGVLGGILRRLAGGTEALWFLQSST